MGGWRELNIKDLENPMGWGGGAEIPTSVKIISHTQQLDLDRNTHGNYLK